MRYVPPDQPGSIVSVEPRCENLVAGEELPPTHTARTPATFGRARGDPMSAGGSA